jgi:hypothetical protein
MAEPPRDPPGERFEEPWDDAGDAFDERSRPAQEETREHPYEAPYEHAHEAPPEHPYDAPYEHAHEAPQEYSYDEAPAEHAHAAPPEHPREAPHEHAHESEHPHEAPHERADQAFAGDEHDAAPPAPYGGERMHEQRHEQLEAPFAFDDDDLTHAPADELLGDLGAEVHSASELAQRRAQERAERRRAGRRRLLVLIGGLVVVIVIIVLLVGGGGSKTPSQTVVSNPLMRTGSGPGHLLAGSQTSALSANILVADRNNNRLVVISPEGQVVWQRPHSAPSSAFLSSTAKSVIVTESGTFVAAQFAVADGKVLYSYGRHGQPGSGANRLRDPETAQELASGDLVLADKTNCRVLVLSPHSHIPLLVLGKPGACVHRPPTDFAYPDSAFPALGGGIVVTELNPAWVDILSASDTLLHQIRVPALSEPVDANEYAKGKLIATSHSHPGVVEEFDTSGKVSWSYGPSSGVGELNRPTLAQVLPDGNVLVADSGNDRVVVIDPQTNTIIWQYGHIERPGRAAGYLHTPDTAVLVPSA